MAAVPVLVVGGAGAMLVEHRWAGAPAPARAALYAVLGGAVALLTAVVLVPTWSGSGLWAVAAGVGALSGAGGAVWADAARRRHERRDERRAGARPGHDRLGPAEVGA